MKKNIHIFSWIILSTFMVACTSEAKGPSDEKIAADYKAHKSKLAEENNNKLFSTSDDRQFVVDNYTFINSVDVINKKTIAEDRISYDVLVERLPEEIKLAIAARETREFALKAQSQYNKVASERRAIGIQSAAEFFEKKRAMYTAVNIEYQETSKDFWKVINVSTEVPALDALVQKKNSEGNDIIIPSAEDISGTWFGFNKPGLTMLTLEKKAGKVVSEMKFFSFADLKNYTKDTLTSKGVTYVFGPVSS